MERRPQIHATLTPHVRQAVEERAKQAGRTKAEYLANIASWWFGQGCPPISAEEKQIMERQSTDEIAEPSLARRIVDLITDRLSASDLEELTKNDRELLSIFEPVVANIDDVGVLRFKAVLSQNAHTSTFGKALMTIIDRVIEKRNLVPSG